MSAPVALHFSAITARDANILRRRAPNAAGIYQVADIQDARLAILLIVVRPSIGEEHRLRAGVGLTARECLEAFRHDA